MTACNICGAPQGSPIYVSDTAITSLCEPAPGPTEVYFCEACGHLRSTEMADLAAYYDTSYKILLDSEEEDQVYRAEPGRLIYRVDHQVETLERLVALPAGARVLDFGCAKSATMRKLLVRRPDLAVHLFDVSTLYVPFWERFLPPERWATHTLPDAWWASFDVVTSFFALEHVSDPAGFLHAIARLLRPGGTVYLIVPNPATNPADVVVVDHVNHFSRPSLGRVLVDAGFRDVWLDAEVHQGAWVARARLGEGATLAPPSDGEVAAVGVEMRRIAAEWAGLGERVRAFELAHAGQPLAVYGSGFYGTFMATQLANPERVACFLDRNPHRQGKALMGRPVVAPDELPEGVRAVLVGLNPAIARANIAQVAAWGDRRLDFFYA